MGASTRSILRYPGSKARFAPLVGRAVAALGGPGPKTLIEPFCGGASVSIALLEQGLIERAVLNDADPLIAALWREVFRPGGAQALAALVERAPLTLAEFDRQKALAPHSQLEAAWKGLYLNRTSFNGALRSSGPIGGRGQASNRVGDRFNRERLIARLGELSSLCSRVEVHCESWSSFLWARAGAPGSLLFLDPPYWAKADDLYGMWFSQADHQALRDRLATLSCPWLLSYDDAEPIRALYAGVAASAAAVGQPYSTNTRRAAITGRELLLSNMPSIPRPPAPKRPDRDSALRVRAVSLNRKR